MKKTILITLVGGLLFAGCGPAAPKPTPSPIVIEVTFPAADPTATEEPTAPAPTPVTLIGELTAVATFTQPEVGFAFDYPADWSISALPDMPYASISIYSRVPTPEPGVKTDQDSLPAGVEKLDIVPVNWATYEELIQQRHDEFAGYTYAVENVTLPSGLTGVLFLVEPKSEGDVAIRVLVTQVNGTPMLVAGLAYEFHYFEAIAFSLRPVGE
ncbi:MAG: hypothetical protein EPO32_14060 [Anaerolineae bacterium]|nr:MAG: hypothetical protein EPO32_14060 [Anaerolineae bacterium]